MAMRLRTIGMLAVGAALIGMSAGAAPARFANPMQPWSSADGEVHLLRPIVAPPTRADTPLGSLMAPGWRLVWDGSPSGPGQVVIRLTLKVVPPRRVGTASEVLQIGRSRDPRVVRQCLTYGLGGPSGRRLADRVINGRRYAAWANGDAGMSQSIAATDLRTVVRGTCYAIECFRYGETASDGDPRVRLTMAQGAALLDAAVASVQLGQVPGREIIHPQTVSLPVGAVAH